VTDVAKGGGATHITFSRGGREEENISAQNNAERCVASTCKRGGKGIMGSKKEKRESYHLGTRKDRRTNDVFPPGSGEGGRPAKKTLTGGQRRGAKKEEAVP